MKDWSHLNGNCNIARDRLLRRVAIRTERRTVVVPDLGACWLWQGAITDGGYGVMSFRGRRGYVHRLMYEHAYGLPRDGRILDHLCRQRRCCRPSHLEAVTQRTNALRGIGPSAVNATKTHCPQGHPYDAANTYFPRCGSRQCRECTRKRARERMRLVARRKGIPERSTRLSPDQVRQIRSALIDESGKSVAARYGVSQTLVSQIRHRQTYAWVE